jgi:hypothetical protein
VRRASDKRGKAVIDACVKQGWTVKRVSCGWMLLSPDGRSAVTLHTSQNEMGYRQVRSRLRRHGVEVAA